MGKVANAINKVTKAVNPSATPDAKRVKDALSGLVLAFDGTETPAKSTAALVEQIADVYSGGGGSAAVGETVIIKADDSLSDFGFNVFIGSKYVVASLADTEGQPVAAGASIRIPASDRASGSYKIGDGEAQALERDGSDLTFTIPVDTPADTVVEVSGNF